MTKDKKKTTQAPKEKKTPLAEKASKSVKVKKVEVDLPEKDVIEEINEKYPDGEFPVKHKSDPELIAKIKEVYGVDVDHAWIENGRWVGVTNNIQAEWLTVGNTTEVPESIPSFEEPTELTMIAEDLNSGETLYIEAEGETIPLEDTVKSIKFDNVPTLPTPDAVIDYLKENGKELSPKNAEKIINYCKKVEKYVTERLTEIDDAILIKDEIKTLFGKEYEDIVKSIDEQSEQPIKSNIIPHTKEAIPFSSNIRVNYGGKSFEIMSEQEYRQRDFNAPVSVVEPLKVLSEAEAEEKALEAHYLSMGAIDHYNKNIKGKG